MRAKHSYEGKISGLQILEGKGRITDGVGWVIVSRGAVLRGRNLLLDHARDTSEVRKDVGAGSSGDIFAHQDSRPPTQLVLVVILL